MRIPAAVALLFPLIASGSPPGSPMSEFGPSQVSVSLFFDHSGQDLYQEAAPSLMNSTGLSVDYAPWPYIPLGIYAGADEFDVDLADGWLGDTTKHGFDSDYKLLVGGTGKLATPRFASNMLRLVAFGGAGYFENTDKPGNVRKGITYNAGASIQCAAWQGLNLILGGEFYAIDGDQEDVHGNKQPFGLTAASTADYFRGLAGVEYYFKGKNRPFISISFRPAANLGWIDQMGLRNGSICVSLGAIASLPGKGKDKAGEEESSALDE
jgi:hypothetical protein